MEIELVDPPMLGFLALEALEALQLYAPRVAPSRDRRMSFKIDLRPFTEYGCLVWTDLQVASMYVSPSIAGWGPRCVDNSQNVLR